MTARELLELPAKRQKRASKFLLDPVKPDDAGDALPSKKPSITKPVFAADSVRSRLGTFLPNLKAANDALPSDTSSIQIEAPEEATSYIEMDLGLGVLEKKHTDSSSDDSVAAADEGAILGQLLKTGGQSNKPAIVEMQSSEESEEEHEESAVLPVELQLTLHPALVHYRLLAHIDHRLELEIVLSLMTRILKQLAKRSKGQVGTITQLNVLQEDMLKLMARRDTLLREEQSELVLETVYLEELDKLMQL